MKAEYKSVKLDYALTLHKNISQWFTDLNMRHDAINLLEESMGKMFSDISWTFVFLGHSPKVIEIKPNMNKGDLIKLTSFCTAKKTIKKKKKRQPKEWEKVFANDAIDQGLISNKQTIQLNNKKIQSKNGQKTLIDISPKKTCRWPGDT